MKSDITTLEQLPVGATFTLPNQPGEVWVRWDPDLKGREFLGCVRVAGGEGGPPTLFGRTLEVKLLDLPTLLEEHALFRRLLADVGQDHGYSVGVWAERGEVVRMLEEAAAEFREARVGLENDIRYHSYLNCEFTLAEIAEDIRARGPTATPDPPARLAKRVLELEEALRGLLADAEATEEYWHGTDPAEVLPSVLAARAALGTK
jgi:hypothetical protein